MTSIASILHFRLVDCSSTGWSKPCSVFLTVPDLGWTSFPQRIATSKSGEIGRILVDPSAVREEVAAAPPVCLLLRLAAHLPFICAGKQDWKCQSKLPTRADKKAREDTGKRSHVISWSIEIFKFTYMHLIVATDLQFILNRLILDYDWS